jgi:DNA-binding NtrC family response regulator
LEAARASFERDIVETSLRANGNNVSKTARQLGVSRVTLYRAISKLNIEL